jgi:hypothetical protein
LAAELLYQLKQGVGGVGGIELTNVYGKLVLDTSNAVPDIVLLT